MCSWTATPRSLCQPLCQLGFLGVAVLEQLDYPRLGATALADVLPSFTIPKSDNDHCISATSKPIWILGSETVERRNNGVVYGSVPHPHSFPQNTFLNLNNHLIFFLFGVSFAIFCAKCCKTPQCSSFLRVLQHRP